jgi:hypothetical protein
LKRIGFLGLGLIENVLEAYNFLANNYRTGDQLFFFGFSRGAYTVRAAAGLVCQLGVLKPAAMPAFMECYNNYIHTKDDPPKPFNKYQPWMDFLGQKNDYFIATKNEVTIQVIGVWETVGSLGVPDLGHWVKWYKSDRKPYQFYDTNLNDRILHAYQALGLDERRQSFAPAIWKLQPGATTKLVQCWFPGSHINIGGGSTRNSGPYPTGDKEQLAAVTFAWMVDRIRPHLAVSKPALEAQLGDFRRIAALPPKPQGWSIWSYAKSFIWPSTATAVVRKAGYALGDITQSHSIIFWLMAFPVERTPNFHDKSCESLPKAEREYTVEQIHPSVYYRQRLAGEGYEPLGLKGWVREKEEEGYGEDGVVRRGWKWILYGGEEKRERLNEMWEFEIGAFPEGGSLEKRLIEESEAKSIHVETEKVWRSS